MRSHQILPSFRNYPQLVQKVKKNCLYSAYHCRVQAARLLSHDCDVRTRVGASKSSACLNLKRCELNVDCAEDYVPTKNCPHRSHFYFIFVIVITDARMLITISFNLTCEFREKCLKFCAGIKNFVCQFTHTTQQGIPPILTAPILTFTRTRRLLNETSRL